MIIKVEKENNDKEFILHSSLDLSLTNISPSVKIILKLERWIFFKENKIYIYLCEILLKSIRKTQRNIGKLYLDYLQKMLFEP